MYPVKEGVKAAANMAMIAITTISSIKVKADFFFLCLAVISFGSRFFSILIINMYSPYLTYKFILLYNIFQSIT